jgi:hypothetical protein
MTFIEFKESWLQEPKTHERKGQSLVNHLHGIWLDEYKRLSSVHYYKETNIDCYFNDDLIENTLTHLKKVWINYPN